MDSYTILREAERFKEKENTRTELTSLLNTDLSLSNTSATGHSVEIYMGQPGLNDRIKIPHKLRELIINEINASMNETVTAVLARLDAEIEHHKDKLRKEITND